MGSYKWQIKRNQMNKARMYGGNYGAFTDKEGKSWLQQQVARDPNFIRNSDQSQWGRDAYYHWKDQGRGGSGGGGGLPNVRDLPMPGVNVNQSQMPAGFNINDNGLLVKVPVQGKPVNVILPGSIAAENARKEAIQSKEVMQMAGTSGMPTGFARPDWVSGGQFRWADQTVADRAKTLKDPNFYKSGQITKYTPEQQQEILADPNFDWKQVPEWQKSYFEVSSRPAAMGAVQGGLMGMAGGPIGGAVGGALGAGLGAAAGAAGYDQTKEWWEQGDKKFTLDKRQWGDNIRAGFGLMNWLAEGAEKVVGTGVQIAGILTGNDPNFDPTKRNLDITLNKNFNLLPGEKFNPDLITGATWEAGAGAFEAMAPAVAESMRQYGLLDNILNGKAPTAEELKRIGKNVLMAGIPQVIDLFTNPEKYKGTEYYLGAADPIAVEKTIYEKLNEAKDRIAAGENYRQVMTDAQTGILAQVGDMVGQAVADPLNVMPKAQTQAGAAIADVSGNKVAAQALGTSGGLIEAAGKYKTLVQTGMAATIDPNFKVSDMSGVSRFIAGINSKGEVKAGNIFGGNSGLLDPVKNKTGWVEDLASQTPHSRAQQGAAMFYENIGAMLTMMDDPTDAAKYLNAIAKGDNETWAQLGSRFADSPEFYTVLPALKAFSAEKLGGILQAWEITQGNRDMLTNLSNVLGEEPGRLLEDLARNGTAEQDFARVVERLRQSTDPQAKALLADVEAGRFTAETLKQTVDVFTGDGALAWHPGQWKAQMLDTLGEHFDGWVTERLMLDKSPEAVSAIFRTTALMKQAQSILLLGGSPGYAITNGLSNMVHRAATGIYGYLTPNQINGFMDRMGVTPARLEEGVGIGGQVEMASGKSAVKMDAMSEAVKGKGPLTNAKNILGKISKNMPFSRLSSWFEANEGKQAFAIGMKQFWSQSWRRGVGFSKMTPELTKAIGDMGIDPGRIYSAIEAGMNQAEIEKALFGRYEGVQARSLVNDAAQKSGMSAAQAADLLEKAGVLDALEGSLQGRTTADGVRAAFAGVRRQAQDWVDMQTGADLKAIAESVKQRVGLEGATAALDVVQKANGVFTDAWLDHYSRFGEVMNDLKLMDDPAQRSKAIELSYKQSDEEFRRVYARHAANYQGIFEAWGMSGNPDALQMLKAIGDVDAAMRDAYAQMREIRRGFFDKWRDDMGNPASYDEWQANDRKIDTVFKKAFETKKGAEIAQGKALAGVYERMYGPAAGEAARLWWEDVVKFNDEIVQREKDFRDSLQDMDADERRIAKQEFYQKDKVGMIVESDRINGEGIARLERAIKGGGDQGMGNRGGPTKPTPSPMGEGQAEGQRSQVETTDQQRVKQIADAEKKQKQAQADRIEEYNALMKAAEQRQAKEQAVNAERVKSVWDVAEGYAREGLGYDRAILQDKFALLAALKKTEYGGVADLAGLNDPRLTPELVKEILDRRQAVKEAQAASQMSRAVTNAEQAASKAKPVKDQNNITILRAIAGHGGLDITRAVDVVGERRPRMMPGLFSKNGFNKGWDISDMARFLADDGYPIDLNLPDDMDGVRQATDLIQRALNKEKIYPIGHDYEAALAKAQEDAAVKAFGDSFDFEQPDLIRWQDDFDGAIKGGDLTRMYELIGDFPEELNKTLSPSGEAWDAYMSRVADETAARVETEARDQAVAEHVTRAQQEIIAQETRAEAVTTRQLMKEKFQETFDLTDAQADAYMELSDALAGWVSKATGENPDAFYTRYYEDAVKAEEGATPLDSLKQAYGRIEVEERTMTRADAENYARMLVRGGEGELRAAIRNEANKADRIAILDEAHKMDPQLAESVARGEMDMLFQEAYHGTPHKFDKFTLDHMGTGEGAQAYGWGLYFAGDQKVADWYREKLSSKSNKTYVDGKEIQFNASITKTTKEIVDLLGYEGAKRSVANTLLNYYFTYDGWSTVQKAIDNWEALGLQASKEIASELLGELQQRVKEEKGQGQLYAVELPDEGYLLWDKPLSEQPQAVRDALAGLYDKYTGDRQGRLQAYSRQEGVNVSTSIYQALSGELGSDKAASLALREAGINGIQYLDGSSRGKGEGNYNYVIFDEDAVRIKETYYQTDQQAGRVQSAKGAVTFDGDGMKATIHAFEAADFTTLIHENGHVFRRVLSDVAERTGNAQIKADLATVEEWAGVKDGKWNRAAEEKFARGFEEYVATGQAPLPKLRAAFEAIRTWMLDVYKTITGSAIDVKISDDVRAVFDRMLGAEKVEGQGLKVKGQKLTDVHMAETFNYGGEIKTRFEIMKDLEAKGGTRQMIDMYMAGLEKSQAAGGQMFPTGQDTPLFSGTAQRAQAEVFTPKANETQTAMFDMRPKFGEQVQKNLEKVKSGQPKAEDMLFQKAEPIETPAFKNWFGQSKVVDENGRPLVVYHGTGADFQIFDSNKAGQNFGLDEEGFFFTDNVAHNTPYMGEGKYAYYEDPYSAGGYAKNAARKTGGGANVMPVYLKLENPMTTNDVVEMFSLNKKDPFDGSHPQDYLDDNKKQLIQIAKEEGYDGIWLTDGKDNIYAAFNPEQIKSTANRGTFDPENPNILFQEADQPFGSYDAASQFLPQSEVMDAGWAQQVHPLLDAMQEGAIQQLGEKPLDGAVRDMSPEGQKALRQYMQKVKGEMATSKLATVRHAEQKRDFAMLNYSRRYGFDRMLDAYVPYQFYQTRTMVNWAARALDKPALFSNYARLHNQMNRYERDIPERLRGRIKINAPWLPEWMGDGVYIDPIGNLFPPATLLKPFERMTQQHTQQQLEAERILQEWAADGKYSETELQQAVQSQSGKVWERAFAEAQMRRESEINNPMDFFNTMFGPAWYLTTPYKLATGKGNEITSTPLGRTSRAIETVTKDTWAEPVGQVLGLLGKAENWGKKKLGIPEFGEYGDYYVDRQLANMVADGVIDAEQAQIAMVERQGEIFDQARERVKMEEAMRVPLAGTLYAGTHGGAGDAAKAALPSLFGASLLPAGELEYRGLKQEWNEAWKKRDAGDTNAINDFFAEHPEYEAYLAKGKPPEERLKSFLIGQVWDGYMGLGETNKREARSQMGEAFQQSFLDKETRSYDTLDTDTLTQWAQMLGKMTPKTTPPPTPPQMEKQFGEGSQTPKLDLYDPAVTNVTDQFFNQRKQNFPNYYEKQTAYYNLTRSEQPKYLANNPDLKAYFDWKDKWYKAYPEYKPIFNGQAFKTVDTGGWPPMLEDYVRSYAYTGGRLPNGAYKALQQVWISEGQPMGDYQTWLNSQVVPAMMYGNQ